MACALLIVFAALAFRASGLDWDRRRLLHPDERFLVMTTAAMPLPTSVGNYLAGSISPLNPRNTGQSFAYGVLPHSLTRMAMADEAQPRHARTVLTGRRLSVGADMLTLLVLGWIALRLHGPRTALVAMALYACAVLPIQHSHFFVVDGFLTLWCTVALACAARLHARPRPRQPWLWGAGAGAAIGGAVACKIIGVLLLVPFGTVVSLTVLELWRTLGGRRALRCGATLTLVGAVACLLTLRVAAPDMFTAGWLPWPAAAWLADMREAAKLAADGGDWPPSFQWAGRTPVWFPWWNLVRFGLGLPLGLTATAAVGVAAWIALGHRRSRHIVPALWCLTLGGFVASQFVTTMRYLLPIYPMLCLLAAWFLVTLVRVSRRRHGLHRAAIALLVLVVVGTGSWALAFTDVYRQLHPRLAASRWIFDHIPAGAVLTAEHWDDALPITASLRTQASRYQILTLPVTGEDTPAKADILLDGLDRSSYVVLSSARASATLPRLPHRFPMMVRYYTALDDGRLGFDLAATFTSMPRLGPFTWPDAHAEEAFTVYDHPTVRIFRKRASWSRDVALTVLTEGLDWDGIVATTARQATAAPRLLELDAAARTALLQEGTWRDVTVPGGRFAAAAPSTTGAIIRWLGAIVLIGLLAWPACAVLLRDTWGRGVLVAPALGLLWVTWVVWVWGHVGPTPISKPVILGALASLGGLSAALGWPGRASLASWLGEHRALILGQVGSVVAMAILGIALRAGNPDLWHPTLGGEKPMDIALLNAMVRADRFPAFDPWFAGGVLNYYYVGFVPVALLCRLTGIEPAVAYTLAVGTWWTLTAAGIAIVAGTLVQSTAERRWAPLAAIVAAVIGVVCGNLRQVEVVWRALRTNVEPYVWFWHASRAIPAPPGEAQPITEFPFFTVLFADLHAHLLAMPWLLAAVLVSLHISQRPEVRSLLPGLALGGLLVGMLAATNAWDAPTAMLLLAGATALALVRTMPPDESRLLLRRFVVLVGLLAAVAAVTSWPFWSHFAAPAGGVTVWRGSRTPWWAGLLVHGPFLLVVVPAMLVLARTRGRAPASRSRTWLGMALGIGLVLLAVVEVLVVRGDVGRMNTVFKVYLQVWLLWSACLPAAWLLVVRALPTDGWRRPVFAGVTVGTCLVMLMYPITATGPRLAHRMAPDAPVGLDGTVFMRHAAWQTPDDERLPLAEDLQVIRWLLDHVRGTPTIVEAQTDQYQWGARISAHTGLPTVLGWTWHARQQRMALPARVVGRRYRDVRAFYETTSADEAWSIALRYDVRLVIVGRLEQHRYDAAGLAKFDADPRWRLAYRHGASRVYARAD